MTKLLSRLAFALWIVGAPMLLIGCGEEKPAASTPAATPAPAPGGGADTAKAK